MSLTVKQLIEKLQKFNPDAMIVMSRDAEGNSYSPAQSVEPAFYVEEKPWHGYLAEEAVAGTTEAVVFWPTN